MIKEKGSASVFIDLTDGIIKMYHGTDKILLCERVANNGDWDKIIKQIRGK